MVNLKKLNIKELFWNCYGGRKNIGRKITSLVIGMLFIVTITISSNVYCQEENHYVLLWDDPYLTGVVVNPQNDNIIFVIKDQLNYPSKLYISEDWGLTWNYKMSMNHIIFDNINPNIAYGSYEKKLYRSDDNCETFILVNELPNYIGSLFADRFDSGKLYVSTRPSASSDEWGIYISEDGGDNIEFNSFRDFIHVPVEYEEATRGRIIWDMCQDPQNKDIVYFTGEDSDHSLRETGNYRDDPYFVIRTLNGGLTFLICSYGLPWHSITTEAYADSSGETQIIMGTEGSGIYKLEGHTWEKVQGCDGVIRDYLVDPENLQIHYYTTGDDIFKSFDAGDSWLTFFDGNGHFRIGDLSIDSLGNLYFTSYPYGSADKGGIYRIGDIVPNQKPCADFNYMPEEVRVESIIRFTDNSYDNDGEIESRFWNFGDGTTSAESHPTHIYEAEGTYTVSLKVTDNEGGHDTETKSLIVYPAVIELATITGTVKDNYGDPIGSTKIELYGAGATTVLETTTTNANGVYVISDIVPDVYDIEASKSGYDNNKKTYKTIYSGENTIDFVLALPELEDSDQGEGGNTPGFEIVFVIVALLSVAYYLRKRK